MIFLGIRWCGLSHDLWKENKYLILSVNLLDSIKFWNNLARWDCKRFESIFN
jgi:hypothetical protein